MCGARSSSSPYPYIAGVRFHAPETVLGQHISGSSATTEADGPDACIVTAGADDPERMVFCFATLGCDFEMLEPPEVVRAVRAVCDRLQHSLRR